MDNEITTFINKLREKLYTASPFNLGSEHDEMYRDAINSVIGEPKDN